MFTKKRDTAKISDRTPVFHVRYIGSTETHVASGKGCSYVPVQRLWDNSPGEKHLRKVAININTHGILLKDVDKRDHHGTQTSTLSTSMTLTQEFRIEDISFCNTDSAVNDHIFSWIVRSSGNDSNSYSTSGDNSPEVGRKHRLDCHAVLCSTKQKAQTMAIVLSRAFQIAYKDWRAHNRSSSSSIALATSRISSSLTTSKSGSENSGTKGQQQVEVHGGTSSVTASQEDSLSNASGADVTSSSLSSSSSPPADMTSPMSAPAEMTSFSSPPSLVDGMSPSSLPPADVTSQQKSSSLPSSPPTSPKKSTHFSDEVTLLSENGSLTHMTTFHPEPRPPPASTGFMRSSILDPDVEEAIRGVDCLSAEYDLDESDSESQ